MPLSKLSVGQRYSKSDLAEIFENPNINLIREGLWHLNESTSFFFVDLEKKGKADRFHFDDYFQGEFFHWDSQTTQHINTPKIQEIVTGQRVPLLFVRVKPKVKSKTQPFTYCGTLEFVEYEEGTSRPVHLVFRNVDYQDDTDNSNLLEVYSWSPSKIGRSSKTKISKKGEVSKQRQVNYKKPTETERRGLITSRVGQGYYRQQIREKWNYICPVTGSNRLEILIASHIVPWSESTDEERLDVENGILLSPAIDALFDRHLISFDNKGKMVLSKKLSDQDLVLLGIDSNVHITITEGMIPYLERHRRKLDENEN